MIILQSSIEGIKTDYSTALQFFEDNGFTLGDNWQYDHCFFDRVLDNDAHSNGDNFLRIPVEAIDGEIGKGDTTVKLGTPFVLTHVHQNPETDDVNPRIAVGAAFDQFSSPIDKNAPTPDKFVDMAKTVLEQTESQLKALLS